MLSNNPIITIPAIAIGVWLGLKVRAKAKLEFDDVLPSVIHPFPDRFPMFAYDVWTVGVAITIWLWFEVI